MTRNESEHYLVAENDCFWGVLFRCNLLKPVHITITSTPCSRFSNVVLCSKPPVTVRPQTGMEPPNLDVARQLFRTSKKVALTREAYGWKSNRETVTCLIRKRKSYSMFLSPSYDFMRHYSAILGKRRGQKNKESDEQSKEERDVTEPLRRWDYWCEIGQRFPELLIPSLPHDSPYPTSASVHSRPDPPPPPALSAHLSLNSFLLSLT